MEIEARRVGYHPRAISWRLVSLIPCISWFKLGFKLRCENGFASWDFDGFVSLLICFWLRFC